MALDDAAGAEIQRLYADTKVTVAQIGDQFGVSPSAICKLALIGPHRVVQVEC